ncbi:aminotransferase class I/II-fold pyridoxal phosphate-dependent enzyme [Chitinimonas sp. BJB300]|uniref:aminotransferase class I/II-fold pyridoxal phosphate-dependent enzyme n=1 Tax=Chitinimonas sp. BJB300 TaxID=1559339 RepID=UPI000C0F9D3F|nr:aminotransferase class I/II-fold pyridoxal phosphate-dependent enzyme [Chitinimonas sp. BJB300]PHV12607.1 ornithine decarboxylase [Chitinimonas sp. BJB300]TSJ89923.1 aminotransferase class V-fold PLP-dependent enzyme [Chitinimonas sp. BJB300]
MPKPVSRILLVNDEKLVLKALVKGLNAAARQLDNPLGVTCSGVETAAEALLAIREDGEIQAVIVDDQLHGELAGKSRSKKLQMTALDLVHEIHALRPELDVYVLIAQENEDEVVNTLLCETVDGYFYRDDPDYLGWYRIVNAQFQERAHTPFYDKLKQYVFMAKDAWHTPGHSSGDSLRGSPWAEDFYDFMGEHIFKGDLSCSVPMLDSLLHPTGIIEEAQQIAAKAFGARRTFFATNGTSTANKVILQTLLAPGDKLLLDRNCHKSVHHGVVISGALPVYMDSSTNEVYGLFGPVAKAVILKAIEANADARAMILTSCTYDGLRYDLKPIIEAAHKHGIKVIIDEAWYGHARFHPEFRPTALECGADFATQSTHKVMSAFSQASMIHVNAPQFDEHVFRENYNMHTSTSPQYSMIASLDVARRQMSMEGYKLLSRTLALAAELKEMINATGVFRVLELDDLLPNEVKADGVRLDPTKITVDISACGYTVDELQKLLFERFNIQIEKSTFNTITLLLTIGTTKSKVSRLYDALMRISREGRAPRRLYRTPAIPHFTSLKYLPRDAFYCGGQLSPLLDEADQVNAKLAGRISADQIVPYPPGIPVLVPGQVITPEIISYLVNLLRSQKQVELHGVVFDGWLPCIRILTEADELGLRPLDSVA